MFSLLSYYFPLSNGIPIFGNGFFQLFNHSTEIFELLFTPMGSTTHLFFSQFVFPTLQQLFYILHHHLSFNYSTNIQQIPEISKELLDYFQKSFVPDSAPLNARRDAFTFYICI